MSTTACAQVKDFDLGDAIELDRQAPAALRRRR
jgi:hypothetical protein